LRVIPHHSTSTALQYKHVDKIDAPDLRVLKQLLAIAPLIWTMGKLSYILLAVVTGAAAKAAAASSHADSPSGWGKLGRMAARAVDKTGGLIPGRGGGKKKESEKSAILKTLQDLVRHWGLAGGMGLEAFPQHPRRGTKWALNGLKKNKTTRNFLRPHRRPWWR
jgi:hypothetical protein